MKEITSKIIVSKCVPCSLFHLRIASDATRDEAENAQGRTDSDVRPVDALLAGFSCHWSHVCDEDDDEVSRRGAAFN